MKIYFISNNDKKIEEVKKILSVKDFEIEGYSIKINEIQSENEELIVRDKVIKAFKKIKRPLFVEQTGLYIEDFGNLPGGLTQIVWDSLEADKFCDYFGTRKNTNVKAVTTIGYCDGMQIKLFTGEIKGDVVAKPRGDRTFQWDCIFQPKGFEKTFAEMGDLKNQISMRKIALEAFRTYLEENI